MVWGDMQSVLQISVALNAAYFAFREIRTPVLTSHAGAFASAEKEIAEARSVFGLVRRPERMMPFDEATSLYIKRDVFERTLMLHEHNLEAARSPYADDIYRFDGIFRVLCLSMALVGFGLLIMASALARYEIAVGWFLAISGALFLPVLVAAAYNWKVVAWLEAERRHVRELRGKIVAMRQEFARDFLPRYYAMLLREREAASTGSQHPPA